MRLHEINGAVSMDQVITDCMPYLKEIKFNLRHLPKRDVRDIHGDGFHYFSTGESRSSVMLGRTSLLSGMVDKYMAANHHALRYQNTVITSSLGENTIYTLNPDTSGYVLPKGKFGYSYYPNDFNSINEIYKLNSELESFAYTAKRHIGRPVVDEIAGATFDTIAQIAHTIQQEAGSDNLTVYVDSIRDLSEKIAEKLDNVQSTGLNRAFKGEHEIWFNCEGYYFFHYDSGASQQFTDHIREIKDIMVSPYSS